MYYDILISHFDEFFSENEITKNEQGDFCGKGKTFRITYNETSKCYELSLSEDGENFKVISAYLFDERQNEKDTESVAIDFIDTLRKNLGVVKKRTAVGVALPENEGGETVTLSGLTQRLLAIFPEHKDAYKEEVARHGKFLAVDFYKNHFIPSVGELLKKGNKKPVKKYYDAMNEVFIAADNETAPFVVAVTAAAIYDNSALISSAKELCSICPSYYTNIYNFAARLRKNKKLRKTLIKE